MKYITIEWDEKKNISNQQKHGVSFEEAKTVFEEYIPDWIAPDCKEEEKESKYWPSLRTLAQCLPLYSEIRSGAENKTHHHVCRWFKQIVTQEFLEIINNKQFFIPENQE